MVGGMIPEYNSGKRLGPGSYNQQISTFKSASCASAKSAHRCDLAWFLCRLNASACQSLGAADGVHVPEWSGFNAALSSAKVPAFSKIGYLPVVNASPTELAMVHKVLLDSVDVAKKQNQEVIVVVADQAVYAKIQEILWKASGDSPNKFRNIVARMGEFHAVGVLLAVIGKRFADAGLHDLLIEAEMVAAGSVDAVLNGKHYN